MPARQRKPEMQKDGAAASKDEGQKLTLQRWMEIDRLLHGPGLYTRVLADKWGVSDRMVRRYRTLFESMGYPTQKLTARPNPPRRGVAVYWKYLPGKRPMFTASEVARS